MKLWIKFSIAAAIQVVCLVGMIAIKYNSLASGTVVTLEVPRPKDPRSLFSGDYVIIRYAINEIDLTKVMNTGFAPENGDEVYVELEQQGDIWVPVFVSNEKPVTPKLFIKGKVIGVYPYPAIQLGQTIQVEYGIEQYFVHENEGLAYEDLLRQVKKAQVSIDPGGKGMVVDIPKK